MKSVNNIDTLKLCKNSNLLILNLGKDEKYPVFESLEEQNSFDKLWNEECAAAKRAAILKDALATDKFFAVIGTRYVNIHDDYDYCNAMFTNFEDAKTYAVENRISDARIFNEKGQILDALNQKTTDELEKE